MASIDQLLGSVGISGGFTPQGILGLFIYLILGAAGLGAAVGFAWWFGWKRKKWNIIVNFKLPRNVRLGEDGYYHGDIIREQGKGALDPHQGVVWLKRKGKNAVPMKVFDIKQYLGKNNVLDVVQIGLEDYKPIIDDSYTNVVDEETGEEGALLKTKIDTTESKAWRNQFEREKKEAFSIKGLFNEHGDKIIMGFILFVQFVGFAILWTSVN